MVDNSKIRWEIRKINAKPFKINEFLTLKFEGGNTTLYVDNKPFRQCMSLMIDISPALAGFILISTVMLTLLYAGVRRPCPQTFAYLRACICLNIHIYLGRVK